MARIDQFILGLHLYDLDELQRDLLGKILTEHAGEKNAIRHSEVCHYYFDPRPISLEDEALISNILQGVRAILQQGDWFLDWRRRSGWFAVTSTNEAFDHLLRRAKREVRLHQRILAAANIATGKHYQLPASNPLIQAIHGISPAIQKLEEAVDNPELPEPPQLPEGNEDAPTP